MDTWFNYIRVYDFGNDIKLSDQITSLGVIMDSTLTFYAHVTVLCKASHYHLRSLRHIRRSLSTDMAISIAVAMVQSRLDYCNSLLYGISAFNINKLQQVQNLAAKIALNDWHLPSQELLSQLHWLPVHSRIKFKISSLTFKLLAENQPANLRSIITPYVPPRLLRSSDKSLLVQPPTRTSIGKRTFSVSAPYVWNSIPLPFLHLWHRLNETWKHFILLLLRHHSDIFRASDSAIDIYLFIYLFINWNSSQLLFNWIEHWHVQMCVLLLLLLLLFERNLKCVLKRVLFGR